MVELMGSVLDRFSAKFCLIVDGGDVDERDGMLMCCDMEGEGRISPEMFTFVVGDMGAEVLNSNAR